MIQQTKKQLKSLCLSHKISATPALFVCNLQRQKNSLDNFIEQWHDKSGKFSSPSNQAFTLCTCFFTGDTRQRLSKYEASPQAFVFFVIYNARIIKSFLVLRRAPALSTQALVCRRQSFILLNKKEFLLSAELLNYASHPDHMHACRTFE